MYAFTIDIVFANETWLSNSVHNVEILHYSEMIEKAVVEVSCSVLGRDYLKLFVKFSITTLYKQVSRS